MQRVWYHGVLSAVLGLLVVVAVGLAHGATSFRPEVNQEGKDVVWVPTEPELVETMLDLAQITPADTLIDLGSGDGSIVIAAARRGATALGIEYNPDMVAYAEQAAAQAGVSDKASFVQADIFESDFSQATVISMFLLPGLNMRLRPQILDLRPGTRIVSNTFDMGDWPPDGTVTLPELDSSWRTAYLWIVPAKVDGTWKTDTGRIAFSQQFQEVSGVMTANGTEVELVGSLNGPTLSFSAGGLDYTGTVSGDVIDGTRSDGQPWQAAR